MILFLSFFLDSLSFFLSFFLSLSFSISLSLCRFVSLLRDSDSCILHPRTDCYGLQNLPSVCVLVTDCGKEAPGTSRQQRLIASLLGDLS